MSMFDGLSECWALGPICRPWWEAWAAIGGGSAALIALGALVVAWIGVGITAASAFAVWKLGVAANNASAEATHIAKSEADRSVKESERREYREGTEELLVLAQITGEVGTAYGLIGLAIKTLIGEGVGKSLFVLNVTHRKLVLRELDRLKFPLTAGVRDRMYFLDRKIAGRLLRATGLMTVAQEGYSVLNGNESNEEIGQIYDGLLYLLTLIHKDLEAVNEACSDAMGRLGLADVVAGRALASFGFDL